MSESIDNILDIYNEVNKIVNDGDQEAELLFIYTSKKENLHLIGGSQIAPENTAVLLASDIVFNQAELEVKKQIVQARKSVLYLASCILEKDEKAKEIFLTFLNK